VKLVFQTGPLQGKAVPFKAITTIGRGASNTVVIPDPSVSLLHAEIAPTPDGRWNLRDFGSTNGTFLNGQRVVTGEIHDRDRVAFGANEAEVFLPAAAAFVRIDIELDQLPSPADLADGPRTIPGLFTPAAAPAAAPDGLTGNIFAEVTYFLKRQIARGGMGAVYEAEQFGAEGFVKKVALKTILPALARNEAFVASFVGEARLVANLVHPNIVQIHHLGRHGDTYFIAMEYIDGISLTAFLALHARLGRRVPVEIATFIVSRICRGLEYAHSKTGEDGAPLGIVHRDLSPNNILISREGEVKITDFGVARARQYMREEDESQLVGCIEFMSPEQAACARVDGRSDLFALGLLYHELLTGVRVFRQQDVSLEDAAARIQACRIPDPRAARPELPDAVVQNLLHCLAREPAARPQTAGLLSHALESELYAKGYGPTIVTLAKYVAELRDAK
jgi:serine/threonine-protein kinase